MRKSRLDPEERLRRRFTQPRRYQSAAEKIRAVLNRKPKATPRSGPSLFEVFEAWEAAQSTE